MSNIKPQSALAEGFSEFFYTEIAKIVDKLKLKHVYTEPQQIH